jgi:succinyl-diaminopimelate desuccinylase
MRKENTDTYIENAKDEIISEIIKLVSFPSINGLKDQTCACLEYYLKRAQDFGFKTLHTSDWAVGIVEMGQGDETLGILVHLDVVGIGDPAKWTHDPFDAVQRDGFLWGRGIEDDKGGAVMSLYAMQAVRQLGLHFKKKVWVIVGTSEESHWTDIASFKREFPVPDYGFSPDGMFPIFNIEKGYADLVLDFKRDAQRGIKMLQGGDSPNTVPSKAEITLADGLNLVVQGVSTHSSTPEDGDNAIIKLCAALTAAGKEFDFVRFVKRFFQNSGRAKELKIDDEVDTLDGEYIGVTTVTPTIVALDKEGVKLTVNIRNKFGTGKEDVLGAFHAHAAEFAYDITLLDYLEPMRVSRKLPFLKVMREVSEEYGVDASFCYAKGTSYAKSMANFVSWGPTFAHDPQTAHVEDERLSVESMLLATKIYARFIARIALEEGE